jgi:hypothetical protein
MRCKLIAYLTFGTSRIYNPFNAEFPNGNSALVFLIFDLIGLAGKKRGFTRAFSYWISISSKLFCAGVA